MATERGPQYRISLEALEALRKLRCSFPGCDEPAPGPSGRCGRHVAAVKSAPERRDCEECGADLGLIHGSRIQEGRGKFCSDCWPIVRNAALAERAPTANPDGAREHHRRVAEQVQALEADGWITPERVGEMLGVRPFWVKWGHYYKGSLKGEVHRLSGSPRLLFREQDVTEHIREFVRGGDGRRLSWFQPDHVVARLRGRAVVSTMDEADSVRERVTARRALLRRRRGRRPRTALSQEHAAWVASFTEIREWYERQEAAGELGEVPSMWSMCAEVARERLPVNYERDPRLATRQVYKALKRA